MTNQTPDQTSAIAEFRELHSSGCFVIPNPWDIGSAVYLHHLGFNALATTSAGFAFSHGLPDEVSALRVDSVLDHVREIVAATPLPVNADFQHGYADTLEALTENVTRCVATGVAGLSIEDATGDSAAPLFEKSLAVERIKAARKAIDQTGVPVILTGRCEAWLVGDPNAFKVSVDRLVAYAAAGADCLYAPGVSDPQEISAIVQAVAPKPVNVLAFRPDPNFAVAKLTDLGVRRISVGSSLARVAWGSFIKAAQSIATSGTFEALVGGASFAELNKVFGKHIS